MIPIFALVKGKYINETDSLTEFSKLMKSDLNNKHVKDLYDLWMQYNDVKSLLYSNIDIALSNTLINIAQRSLSKRSYLSFETKIKR